MVSDKWEIAQRTMFFLLSNIVLFTLSGKIFFSLYFKKQVWKFISVLTASILCSAAWVFDKCSRSKSSLSGNLFKNHTLWLWLNFLSASNDRASTDLFCSSLCIYRIFQFCPNSNFVHFSIVNFVQSSILSNLEFDNFVSRGRLKISILFFFQILSALQQFHLTHVPDPTN